MSLAHTLAFLNRARCWRRTTRVWGLAMTPPTFDRWLYLRLHRWGRMGREDKHFFETFLTPGMHVADVGANIGLYSLLMARHVGAQGRIFAFEPDHIMAEALRRNLQANGASQVEVFPCAAGAAAGNGTLHRGPFNSGDNRLWPTPGHGSAREEQSVPIVALDEALRGRRVDFIKMDVQGWEGQALRGIGGLLRANPALTVCLEFWPQGLRAAGSSPRGLQDLLAGLGLEASLAEPRLDNAAVDLEVLAATMKPGAYLNLLARRP